MKKYKLSEKFGTGLYRVIALRDIDNRYCRVKVGDVGGYVANEKSLSQENSCWIFGDATVCDDAAVCDSATVCDDATVCEYASV